MTMADPCDFVINTFWLYTKIGIASKLKIHLKKLSQVYKAILLISAPTLSECPMAFRLSFFQTST